MADAADSKSVVLTGLWVQVPPSAPRQSMAQSRRMGGGGRRSRAPSVIGDLLGGLRAQLAQSSGCLVDREVWSRALGSRIAARSMPDELSDGTLTVTVVSSVWAQELTLLSGEIARRLRELGFEVRAIRCRVGAITAQTAPQLDPGPLVAPPLSRLPSVIEEQLSEVKDDELREMIGAAARSQLGLYAAQTKEAKRRRAVTAAKPVAPTPRSVAPESAPRDRIGFAPRGAGPRTRAPRRG
jgi:hypothetical protein